MNEIKERKRNSFEINDKSRGPYGFNICGNSSIKNAYIIILTDFFDDVSNLENSIKSKLNRDRNVRLINKTWSNQTILVERCPYGAEIDITEGIESKIAMNRRFWDDDDFCVKIKKLNMKASYIELENQSIEKKLNNKEYDAFFNERGEFVSPVFVSLLESSSKKVNNEILNVKLAFKQKRLDRFDYLMRRVITKMEREHQEKVRHLYKKYFQKKLLSLTLKIEEEMKMDRRVIVVANGSLVLNNFRLGEEEFNRDLIRNFIVKKKCVIVSAEGTCLEMINNPWLWKEDPFEEKDELSPLSK